MTGYPSGSAGDAAARAVGTVEAPSFDPFAAADDALASDFDYAKLTDRFGCARMTEDLLHKFQVITKKRPHRFLRRGIFFSHRDFDQLLKLYANGESFYIYTGRGPSSDSMHLGHLVQFEFTRWLQEVFDVPVVIQLTDDEKTTFKDGMSLDEARRNAFGNARDIIAVGFNKEKTFIFRNTDYIRELYPVAVKIQKCLTFNQIKGIFGFTSSDNIGKIAFPAMQAAPSFPQAFPAFLKEDLRCLVPQGFDQDPYFRMTRDVAPRLGWQKPVCIHSKFLPRVHGSGTKMKDVSESCIFLSDDEQTVRDKIRQAHSGGGSTCEEQQKTGANLNTDVAYTYLQFWLEDDQELEKIGTAYMNGSMLTGEVKKKLGDVVVEILCQHQKKRFEYSDAAVRHFMNPDQPQLRAPPALGLFRTHTDASAPVSLGVDDSELKAASVIAHHWRRNRRVVTRGSAM